MYKNVSNDINKNGIMEINNPLLQDKVAIIDKKSRYLNNLLEAAITLKSYTISYMELEYRFIWQDAEHFDVEQTPWLPTTINGRETRSIKQIAHNPLIKNFKFELRPKQ